MSVCWACGTLRGLAPHKTVGRVCTPSIDKTTVGGATRTGREQGRHHGGGGARAQVTGTRDRRGWWAGNGPANKETQQTGPGAQLPVHAAEELSARPAVLGAQPALPPDAEVLTSVCALGSPALAFSRTSSKGVSMSPFTGPLTRKKRAECHKAGPCHLSEEWRARQEWALGLEQLLM